MAHSKILTDKQTLFIDYLLSFKKSGEKKLPPIKNISAELGLSTPIVREQIELAKNLGLIEIKPRIGIKLLPYNFSPAVTKSVFYAILSNKKRFKQFSDLRNQLEKAYFFEAVNTLEERDITLLKSIVEAAIDKIGLPHAQIPHAEHRKYHLKIYEKIENVFLKGLLEAYWDLYELVGMDMYNDLQYLKNVWEYHQKIVEEIELGNSKNAFSLLDEHMELIDKRN